ncbi:hypothetical protein LY474_03315 [Myxococcus stipitatus]|uniref:hypothetical protein n=1 Tax=Myxococcus stipitatus TaxID=83455 RepID=UPI001F289602|nr:hypothetical protein [Myxococcus stipitatus]MCE9666834.1 hypothetical protein [Myxococcus stipitatus]
MAGPLTTFLLSGILAAAPGGFTFEGRTASARTEQPDGFFIQGPLPFTDLAESGTGSATLDVQDRVDLPEATYGDQAAFSATFRLGATEYRVELSQAGFPPLQRFQPAPSQPLPAPPPHTIGGGVLLGVPLYGDSGLGWAAMTRTHAAIAVWGVGSVWRNGHLLTDAAFVHVAALDAGAFADDDTHRLLRQARFEDTELVVLVWNLPARVEPRGFVQFVFEDVSIDLDGRSLPWVAVVENTGNITVDPRWLTPVPPSAYAGGIPVLSSPEFAATGGSGVTGTPAGTMRVSVGGATTASGAAASPLPVEPQVTSGAFPTPQPRSPPVNITGVPTVTAVPSTTATAGSFSVVPLSQGNFNAFSGTAQVSPGILATAPPLNSSAVTPSNGLLAAPAPITASPATPLFGAPTPLNATPAAPLPGSPAPGNVAAGASPVAPAPAAPAAAPGGATPSR